MKPPIHFLFDACLPHRLAQGLELMDQENTRDINIKITHVATEYGDGILDPDVVPIAQKLNAILVSEDDDFKKVKAVKALVKNLKVGYVLYKPPPHGIRYWEKSVALILAWENLKEEVRNRTPPFILTINKNGHISEEAI